MATLLLFKVIVVKYSLKSLKRVITQITQYFHLSSITLAKTLKNTLIERIVLVKIETA